MADPRPLTQTISYLIAQTCKAHRGYAGTVLTEVGLYPGQEMILVRLWEHDGLSQSELADYLGVQPPTVTKMLQRMEEAGWVARHPCPGDSRVSRVTLTERGRALQGEVERVWATLETQTLAGLTLEEKLLLRRMLMQVHQNLTAGNR